MPKMRVSMRKVREVLRLTHELGLSDRQVSKATGVGKTAVGEFVARVCLHRPVFTMPRHARFPTGPRCTMS